MNTCMNGCMTVHILFLNPFHLLLKKLLQNVLYVFKQIHKISIWLMSFYTAENKEYILLLHVIIINCHKIQSTMAQLMLFMLMTMAELTLLMPYLTTFISWPQRFPVFCVIVVSHYRYGRLAILFFCSLFIIS